MLQKLVIFGAGGHASVVADIVRLEGRFEIVGFLEDADCMRHHAQFCGASILGGCEQLDTLAEKGVRHLIVAFGNCGARLRLAEFGQAKGFQLATAIHPRAVVAAGVEIGNGTVVAANAVLNPGTRVGANCIVNTGATVDHDCVLGEGVHVCPGVHIAGAVHIERAAWIGVGATLSDHIRIGANSFIGAGAVVVKDIPADVVAYGVPARVMKQNADIEPAKSSPLLRRHHVCRTRRVYGCG